MTIGEFEQACEAIRQEHTGEGHGVYIIAGPGTLQPLVAWMGKQGLERREVSGAEVQRRAKENAGRGVPLLESDELPRGAVCVTDAAGVVRRRYAIRGEALLEIS